MADEPHDDIHSMVPSDAPNDIEGVPQFAVLRDEPFPKEISDSGYVNTPAVPSVTEPTPDPMAVQTSVSPVLNMDDLQMVFTTSNNPHHWITFSRVTPAAVVGKLVKPAKTVTKNLPLVAPTFKGRVEK